MQMDIYDHASYQQSISNLAMLKLFHDAGVNVSAFPSMMTHVNFGDDASFDILNRGLGRLFESLESFETEIRHEEQYRELFQQGVPDFTFIIRDALFEKVSHQFADQWCKMVTNTAAGEYLDADIVGLPMQNGIALLIWYPGMLHELVQGVLDLRDKALQLLNGQGGGEDGDRGHHQRRIA